MVLPSALTTNGLVPSASGRDSVRLLPAMSTAVISPSSEVTLPFKEFVGEEDKVRGERLKVGVIENPVNPSTFKQSPIVADCETCRSSERPMLAPVTVMGVAIFTVAVAGRANRV